METNKMALYPYGQQIEGLNTDRMYLVFNPDTTPVKATPLGHIVGARETVWIESNDDFLLTLAESGRLRIVRQPLSPPSNVIPTEEPINPTAKQNKASRQRTKRAATGSPRKQRTTSKKLSDQ